jgi:hypothetical protein
MHLSEIYDQGFTSGIMGFDFEAQVSVLALGCTDSDRFLDQWEAFERGYAEGVRVCRVVSNPHKLFHNYTSRVSGDQL